MRSNPSRIVLPRLALALLLLSPLLGGNAYAENSKTPKPKLVAFSPLPGSRDVSPNLVAVEAVADQALSAPGKVELLYKEKKCRLVPSRKNTKLECKTRSRKKRLSAIVSGSTVISPLQFTLPLNTRFEVRISKVLAANGKRMRGTKKFRFHSGNVDSGSPGGGGGSGGDYPESLLCPETSDPVLSPCGAAYNPATPLDAATLQQKYSAGLAAWRTHGPRGACAGCHTPDGIELARVGYRDEDIIRRALDHVDRQKADQIVDLVHALRQKYGFTRVLHPHRFRPLQPAHEPFHAAPGLSLHSPAAQQDRDGQFMDHLVNDLRLLWATGRVDSLDAARQAWNELKAIDLQRLRLAVPFDLLSEDLHHGEVHRSAFEWFPGIASTPIGPTQGRQWKELVDDYLANPTDSRFWALYDQIDSLTACDSDIGPGAVLADYQRACGWMRFKWRSIQVLGHMLRTNSLTQPDLLADRPGATIQDNLHLAIARNPIWEAGDFLRVQPLARRAPADCSPPGDPNPNRPCTLLPPVLQDTLPTDNEELVLQSAGFQQGWFMMSWIRDPALIYEGEGFATFVGDYLESVFLPHYDITHAFVFAKMAVEKSASTQWRNASGFREGLGRIASVRTFSFKQTRDNFSPPPTSDRRYATHRRMFVNFARMWLYLIEDDLREGGKIYDRENVLYATRFMRTWISELEGAEDAAINNLACAIETHAAAAQELRTDNTPGTGLQPTGRWNAFEEPYC